jgi:U2 small nuclear ribonucleoprotein A'
MRTRPRDRPANTRTFWQERQAAKALFTTADGRPNALADKLAETVSTAASRATLTSDEPKPAAMPGKAGRLMSKDEQARVKEAIANATSIEEIRRLELQLKEGYVPTMDSVGA